MRVIVTGAAGMLGRQVVSQYQQRGCQVFPMIRKDLDITDHKSINNAFGEINPQLVVNCAAYTDVDGAENNRDQAFAVNGLAPRLLGIACKKVDASLVQISTDYIFNGISPRPYLISDTPDPLSVYGSSKLLGEMGVRESGCRCYIVRTSWLFGPGGKNFADTILKLAQEKDEIQVVNDQQGSPTYTPDLARGIAGLAASEIYGTYHLTNSGITTWYGFAQKIIQAAGLKTNIKPCSTNQFPRPAQRPANSALDPFPIAEVMGYAPPSWEEAVDNYIKIYYRSKTEE